MNRRVWIAVLRGAVLALSPLAALAGPPYLTDDPEPVAYQHWEFYIASQHEKTADGWSGTAPHFEVNYGFVPNGQLHLIAPFAYDAPAGNVNHYGYGDTELGVKYRFIRETSCLPQVGTFPLLEIPTGNADRGLGGGHVQAFLPLWLQKSWGQEQRPWTAYGGGGYWINPGAGHRDYWYVGGLLQRRVTEALTVGAEVFHATPSEDGGRSSTGFNLGGSYDLSEHWHVLFSAGRDFEGPTQLTVYCGLQLTL